MMNMKTLLKYIPIVVMLFSMASCQEGEPYSPGEHDLLDCHGLFFPQEQAKAYEIAPGGKNYLTFTVERELDAYEAFAPYELISSEEGFFELENELGDSDCIYFDEDQNKATIKVYYSEDFETGKRYTCTIKVTDPQYVAQYGLSSNELTFSIMVVDWKLLGEGLWRDDFCSSYFTAIGAVIEAPYQEKKVKVYERDDLPGYYRVDQVYTPDYVAYIVDGSYANAEAYTDYCPAPSVYINASDPEKVYIPLQYAFTCPSGKYGDVYMGSDVEEVFDAGYSNQYGTLKDGSITFPKNALVAYLPAAGAAYANNAGKHRLVLPGYRGYDYSVAVETAQASEGVMPVKFTLGEDVAQVKYKVFDGHISEIEMASKLEEVKAGKNVVTVTESGDYEFTADKSGLYTLIACSFDQSGNFKEYTYAKFGYDTVDDPRDVDIHLGLIVSDKYGGSGNTKENSMEFYIYGKDIQDAKIAIYKDVNYEDFKSPIDSLVQFYMPSLETAELRMLNSDGYSGVVDGLAAGVKYTMIAYVDNGYHRGIYTASASTEGTYNPMDEVFQMYDMPKELQPAQQEDYFKDWELWSVDPFNQSKWEREKRGTVRFAEGKDLYFDYEGKSVPDERFADPTKTMEVVSLSGMFPKIKETYGMESDAIDFHYYEGYIYTLMTQMEQTTVKGKDAYPTNAYLYYYGGELKPAMGNFAMFGGFVRNPVDKDSKDVIAFISNPSTGVDFISMCLCWFEDAAMQGNGYLFEEEGHIYPMLVSPDSPYAGSEELRNVKASVSSYMIAAELAKGQTNYVETADGYIMSTIDRFNSLPYNYMENMLEVTSTSDVKTGIPAGLDAIYRTPRN